MTAAKPSAIRLEPADEYLHANTGEPNYTSRYLTSSTRAGVLGGF